MKRIVYFVLMIAVIAAVQCAKPEISLQLNLKPGDTFITRMTTTQQITQTVQNMTNELAQEITMDMRYEVTAQTEEGISTIQATYERVGFSQVGPFGTFEYRSWESPEEVPLAAQGFAILVGKSIGMKMSSRGEVMAVTGIDEIIDAMLESLEMTVDDQTRAMLESNFKRQFGESAVNENMSRMFAFYPEKPVGVGDSWGSTVKFATGIPMIIDAQYRMVGIKDGKVSLDVKSKIEPNKDERITQIMGMDMYYDIHGTQEGTIVLDSLSGWLVEGQLVQNFDGSVKVTSPQAPEESMDLPMTVSSTITFTTIGVSE
ncbi:MAG: hypothetical protein JSW02_07565 [candidate division WOR-3 bacterium]|nr:MAG: hypothetical protein JSW02_07565 [candidate division WOR-3 bacterium]